MRTIVILLVMLYSSYTSAACESVDNPIQMPGQELPTIEEFLNSYSDGVYEFKGNPSESTGAYLSYWIAEKKTFPELPTYRSPSDQSDYGYTLNGCLALDSDGVGIHCQYLHYEAKSCSIGYTLSYDTGLCELTDILACLAAEPEICDDGFPPETGGYSTCDRPDLKACEDGNYVRVDTGICSTACDDYLSCYEHAKSSLDCGETDTINFTYSDPENWEISCTPIAIASPDHPDNSGNADGNPYNDPNTPETGEGSVASVSEIDPVSLADAIGTELEDDLSNIERAVRDDIDQSKVNTNTIETSVNGVEEAVRDSITANDSNTQDIENAIEGLGGKLDTISTKLNSGPCDPSSKDYYDCLDITLSDLPAHSTSTVKSFTEANASFKSRLDGAPVVTAFSNVANMISLEAASCPAFSIDFPAPINETVSTTIHCELMEDISPIISTLMIVLYTWTAFRIFGSA